MNKQKYSLAIFTMLFLSSLYGQDTLTLKNGNVKRSTVDIVYNDSSSAQLPETIILDGTIEDQTGGICGVFCMGGTMKVKMKNPITNYPYQYIYIATGCLWEINIGNKIQATVSKLRQTDKQCYYQGFLNPLNSHGIPFYKLNSYTISKLPTNIPTNDK